MPLFLNEIFFGLLAMIAWGVADYFAAISSRKIGSFQTFFWTQVISLIAYLGLFAFIPFHFDFSFYSLFLVTLTAILMCVAYVFFYKSIEVGKVAIGTSISACWALLTVAIAVVFFRQSLTLLQFFGVLCAMSGILLTSLKKEDFLKLKSKSFKVEKEILFGLIALSAWGVAFSLIDVLVSTVDWFRAIFLIKVLMVIFFAVLPRKEKIKVPQKIWLLLLVGVLETVAYLSYGFGLTHGSSTIVAPVSSTYPIVAIILARLFLKEKMEKQQYVGIGFVLAGVVLLAL
jgi:drug/metabolite transporter (DMT)-like permease